MFVLHMDTLQSADTEHDLLKFAGAARFQLVDALYHVLPVGDGGLHQLVLLAAQYSHCVEVPPAAHRHTRGKHTEPDLCRSQHYVLPLYF